MKNTELKYKLDLQMFAEDPADDEDLGDEEEEEEQTDENDLMKQLKDMKKNYVPKSKYDKVVKERDDLFSKAFDEEDDEEPDKNKVDKVARRKELIDHLYVKKDCKTDLEYATMTLELRNMEVEMGLPDPFAPQGKKITPTQEAYESAEKTAKALSDAIEKADGDNAIFINEWGRKLQG